MGSHQQYSLRWNNYLQHITHVFNSLRDEENLVDVTLCCEGKKIRAHKMLLSACSTYFREIFKENPCQHPVIIFRNVKFEDLEALISFMYKGEVNVEQDGLSSFLSTAELLEVKGLTGNGPCVPETIVEEDVSSSESKVGTKQPSTPKSAKPDSPASKKRKIASADDSSPPPQIKTEPEFVEQEYYESPNPGSPLPEIVKTETLEIPWDENQDGLSDLVLDDASVARLHEMFTRGDKKCYDSDSESLVDETDFTDVREENTDTEQEFVETDSDSELSCGSGQLIGRDKKTIWSREGPKISSVLTKTHLPAVKSAQNCPTPLSCWNLLFSDQILQEIVSYTNHQIGLVKDKFSRERDARDTDLEEIKAFLGLLYIMGKNKVSRVNPRECWAVDMSGAEFCRSVMSRIRFGFLIHHIRFDDNTTRARDKLAPIRELFSKFFQNCQQHYTVGTYVTVDEKLQHFQGKCSFKRHIPSKPAQCGIKLFALTDSRTLYTLNMEIDTGKQGGPFSHSFAPSDVVMRLSTPIHGSGRNITMDNWFTSYALSSQLLEKKLTMVGSVSTAGKEYPSSFVSKNREVHSSLFAFDESRTLVSYKTQHNKLILVLSTKHHDDKVDSLPEIIKFYRLTKSAVDTVDRLCINCDVSRNTSRWPMAVFYALLNIAGINAAVLYHGNGSTQYHTREDFLKSLSFDLVHDHMKRRYYASHLPREMSSRIGKVFNFAPVKQPAEPAEQETAEIATKRKRCQRCDRKKNRFTKYNCRHCKTFICLSTHAVNICEMCYNQFFTSSEPCEMDTDD